MKVLGLIPFWSLAISVTLFCSIVPRIQADPTDDFSFSLAHAPEAEVYTLMSTPRVAEILADSLDLFPKSQTPKLARHLLSLCRQYRFDPAFILSLIQVESSFKIKARSPVGALGLMQLMPGTAQFIARELGIDVGRNGITEPALLDPFFNVTLGVAYLAWLRDHYAGSAPYYLVAAYNIGPARLDELLSRKSFTPVGTKKYFQAIRRGVPEFRFYRHPVDEDDVVKVEKVAKVGRSPGV